MDLSSNIKAIRTHKRIPQAEIARRLEMDASSYHRLENRGSKLTIEQATAIAQALEMSLIELLTWGEQTNVGQEHMIDGDQQKRVSELEDRLKDKQFIISELTQDLEDISELINTYMDYIKHQAEDYIQAGILHYKDADGNAVSVRRKDISENEYNRIWLDLDEVEVETSPEEDEFLIKTIFTHKDFATGAFYFMSTGLIKDEVLIEGYKKYQSNLTGQIPMFHVMKLIETNNPVLKAFKKELLSNFTKRM